MRYTVLIDGKEGAYGVVVPDLPGCTAMGETIEAALANTVDAMRDWAEVIEETGGRVPAAREPEAVIADAEARWALAASVVFRMTPTGFSSDR